MNNSTDGKAGGRIAADGYVRITMDGSIDIHHKRLVTEAESSCVAKMKIKELK